MSKSFGERLRELRELAGLTQQQLATRAGLSLSNLAQTEQGLKGDPKAKTAIALAEALNMSVYDLIGEITVGGGQCMRLTLNSDGQLNAEQISMSDIPGRRAEKEEEASIRINEAWMQVANLAAPVLHRGCGAVVACVRDGKIQIWREGRKSTGTNRR